MTEVQHLFLSVCESTHTALKRYKASSLRQMSMAKKCERRYPIPFDTIKKAFDYFPKIIKKRFDNAFCETLFGFNLLIDTKVWHFNLYSMLATLILFRIVVHVHVHTDQHRSVERLSSKQCKFFIMHLFLSICLKLQNRYLCLRQMYTCFPLMTELTVRRQLNVHISLYETHIHILGALPRYSEHDLEQH